MNWLNWLWGLGIHAVGWPIYEYGRPTLVYIYIPFAERERLREILNAEVAAGRLNREWAENLLRGLAGNVHVRGYGDPNRTIVWTNLDQDIILQILRANAEQAGMAFNDNPSGITVSIGYAVDVYAILVHGTASVELNYGWSKRHGSTFGVSISAGGGPAVGIGGGFGPQITVTTAGSVDQLSGVSRHERIFVNIPIHELLNFNLYEVHGMGYEGIQLSPPLVPGSRGLGIGCSWDEVSTWMWRLR